MANPEIAAIEGQIFELTKQLNALREAEPGTEVPNYDFTNTSTETGMVVACKNNRYFCFD